MEKTKFKLISLFLNVILNSDQKCFYFLPELFKYYFRGRNVCVGVVFPSKAFMLLKNQMKIVSKLTAETGIKTLNNKPKQ